ncbi:MAG: exodeoxyribonuclease VII small subunit [Candidatus Firestonebacteria bacterium]
MAELKFEDGLKRLEEIVSKLEDGNLPLDESLKLFEEGVRLTKVCFQKLEEVEKKVELLVKDKNGKFTTVPFEEKEQGKNNNSTLF